MSQQSLLDQALMESPGRLINRVSSQREWEDSESGEFRLLLETSDAPTGTFVPALARLLSIRVSLAVDLERDCDGYAFEQ